MAAWFLVLSGVVGVAAVGRLAESGVPSPGTAVIEFEPPAATATPMPTASAVPTPELIVLASPAEAGVTITTRELVVQGYLQVAAGTVRVTLEARGNRVIDDATITPALAFGERPTVDRHAQFEVRFGLPNPRPNGRMVVQVAAYDRDGRILDVVRRPFRVGPLLEGVGTRFDEPAQGHLSIAGRSSGWRRSIQSRSAQIVVLKAISGQGIDSGAKATISVASRVGAAVPPTIRASKTMVTTIASSRV